MEEHKLNYRKEEDRTKGCIHQMSKLSRSLLWRDLCPHLSLRMKKGSVKDACEKKKGGMYSHNMILLLILGLILNPKLDLPMPRLQQIHKLLLILMLFKIVFHVIPNQLILTLLQIHFHLIANLKNTRIN